MTTKLFSKPQTQQVIKNLRRSGYIVEKTPSGIYECKLFNELLFAAMPGTRGYLVRYDPQLLTAA